MFLLSFWQELVDNSRKAVQALESRKRRAKQAYDNPGIDVADETVWNTRLESR